MPQRIHEKTARLSNVRSGPFFFKGRRDPSQPCSCPENSSEDVSLRSRMPQRIHEKTARLSNVRSGPFFFKGRRDPSQSLRIGIISPWATER